MKSDGAAVRISNASPPASRTERLTSAATPSRCEKQLDSSEDVFTTAIFGFSMSASLRPRARHWARRTAQRGEPGSPLLRIGFLVSVIQGSLGRACAVDPRMTISLGRQCVAGVPPAPAIRCTSNAVANAAISANGWRTVVRP